jgi:glycosyltransferase involved in cell wall biosynthesis
MSIISICEMDLIDTKDTSEMIRASVIIPTFNRADALKNCLFALQNQSYDKNWEIIVVDDGGYYDLSNRIKQFEQELTITLIKQENGGPAKARNNGADKAQGKFLAFLDDDCEPRPHWLKNLMTSAKGDVIVGGKTENKLSDNPYSETSQLLVSFLYSYFEGTPWLFFTSNNFLMEKKAFLEIGGFDETFKTSAGEDREFCVRFSHLKGRLECNSNAIIDHSHDLTFISFWRLHKKYGNASFHYRTKTNLFGVKSMKFSLSFYAQLICFPLRQKGYSLVRKIQLMGLMLVSQLAIFFGVLEEINSRNDE